MFRAFVVAALFLAVPLAGCIGPPALEGAVDAYEKASAPPPEDRVEGMTVDSDTKLDKSGRCQGLGSSSQGDYCADRTLVASGRIGVDALPVNLRTANGVVTIKAGSGDAWSFTAKVGSRAHTEEAAVKGLDEVWSWSHTDGREHFIQASHASLSPSGASFRYANYELVLPAWVVLDLEAKSSNGAISSNGFRYAGLDLGTSNGAVTASGTAANAKLSTSNGGIQAHLVPSASGTFTMSTSNGLIDVKLPEAAAHGYDLSGRTSNGEVVVNLKDGAFSMDSKSHKEFRSSGYDARDTKTKVTLSTSNGRINVG